MFEQTVAIELEKRARLGEFSLKLCVREAFVLVFPAVERHYSMRERERSEDISPTGKHLVLQQRMISTSATVYTARYHPRHSCPTLVGIHPSLLRE